LAALKSFGLAKLASAITWLPVDVSVGAFLWISAVLVIIAVLIGLFGSIFAMRRYLKV
jgi:cell division transport system permease protein